MAGRCSRSGTGRAHGGNWVLQVGADRRTVEHVFASVGHDPLDQIRDGLGALAAEDRSSWSAATRTDRLIELRGLQERIDRRGAPGRGRLGRRRRVARRRRSAAVSWLASKTGLVRTRRLRDVANGAVPGPRHEQHREGARCGRRHGAARRAAGRAPRTDAKSCIREYETTLLDAAATVEVQDFPRVDAALGVARRRRACAAHDAGFAFERRGFTLSPTIGGSVVSGFLDPEAAATVADALAELQPPDGPPTLDRSPSGTPTASCCCASERSAVSLPESRPIGGVEVVVGYDILAGRPVAELDALRCDIEGFGPIARITAERLACDCALGRVVVQRQERDPRPRAAHPHHPSPVAAGDPRARPALPVPRVSRPGRRGATCTTSSTGCTAVRPTSRTARCSAGDTTSPATRAAGSWRAAPTALPSRRERRSRCMPASCRRGSPACRRPARRGRVRRAVRCVHRVLHVVPVRAHRTRRDRHARAHPAALRFPRPGRPKGHVVLGYDEHGRCPMLGDHGCTIYEHRPRTCRTYDCRVFAATGSSPIRPSRRSPPRSGAGGST